MHHYGCVAPNADTSLQSGRFWATVIASSRERLFDLRSCWIVFIHVVRGCPGGFLQFSEGEAVMILLESVSSGILAIWPNRERRRAWTIADRRGCPLVRLTSSFRTWWYHLIHNNFRKHHWSRASILSPSRRRKLQYQTWQAVCNQVSLGIRGKAIRLPCVCVASYQRNFQLRRPIWH